MKNFLKISTSTIGGAIIMLLLNSFLGDKAPWWTEKITIGQNNSITVDVEKIFDNKIDVNEISKNKDYFVDDQNKFYLKVPFENWKSAKENPGKYLDGLSVADIPFLKFSFTAFGAMLKPDVVIHRNEITTSDFFNPNQKYVIKFSDSTKIGTFRIDFNPFKDLEYVKASLKGSSRLTGIDFNVDTMSTESLNDYQELMSDYWEDKIEDLMPEEQTFYNNVTVTTIQPKLLSKSALYRLMDKENELNLFTVQTALMMMNPELAANNIKSFSVSKKNNVLVMETSVKLEDININGKLIPNCELTRFVLIAIKKDMIYIVTMRYLNEVEMSNTDTKEIESIFNSFRLF